MEAHANQKSEYANCLRELKAAKLTIKELWHELTEKLQSDGPEVGAQHRGDSDTADQVPQSGCQK